ncbi:glycosyltransferase family 4 protein [Georgenia halophila]|uniref:D-inositol 3-phosphate glycosyltransferase n=1 Tax=Georgenia halophila TaxID=620889 RepID=A0ABP8KUP2_9MICO
MAGAIVHEWIAASGGSEKVLDAMAQAFPDSDIFTLWSDAPDGFPTHHVYESWLSRTTLRYHKALALPFLPVTWRRLTPRRTYDWVLVSSHLFAHHARFVGAAGALPKFVYVHTPARYIWTPELDSRGSGPLASVASSYFRRLDRKRAREPHRIAANSEYVRQRILNTWQRDATVIHPPVDVDRIREISDWCHKLSPMESDVMASVGTGYLLGASRFVRYKRLDLVIRTGQELDIPVVIAGRGPEEARLREIAGTGSVPVTFVNAPSDALLYALYQSAGAFVFPPVEDFGIMPVEAMASGCPVVSLGEGGAKESVRDGVSGVIARDDTVESIAEAAEEALRLRRSSIPETVARFSYARFGQELNEWLSEGTAS